MGYLYQLHQDMACEIYDGQSGAVQAYTIPVQYPLQHLNQLLHLLGLEVLADKAEVLHLALEEMVSCLEEVSSALGVMEFALGEHCPPSLFQIGRAHV